MRRALPALVWTALLTASAAGLLAAGDRQARLAPLAALAAVAVLACSLLARLWPAPAAPRPVLQRPATTSTVDTGAVQLEWSLGSREHADRVLRPRLARLAAERLQQRHGLDLVQRPDRARLLLGEQTWQALRPADGSGAGLVDPAAVARVLTSLEQL